MPQIARFYSQLEVIEVASTHLWLFPVPSCITFGGFGKIRDGKKYSGEKRNKTCTVAQEAEVPSAPFIGHFLSMSFSNPVL